MYEDFYTAILSALTNLLRQLNIMELYRLGAVSKDDYLKKQVDVKKVLDNIKFE
jgi:hypothetical protein